MKGDDIKDRAMPSLPAIPDHWQAFIVSIILRLLFPLTPLLVEWIETSAITATSLILASAMYSAELGMSSRNQIVFGSTIPVLVVLSLGHGIVAKDPSSNADSFRDIALVIMVGFAFAHGLERYTIHIVDRTPFFEFMRQERH